MGQQELEDEIDIKTAQSKKEIHKKQKKAKKIIKGVKEDLDD